jgi:hypothetical protein
MQEAFLARAAADPPGEGCPDPERVWAAAQGELGAGEMRSLLDHAAGCGACAQAWQLARELSAAPAEGSLASTRPRARSAATWIGVAAAAAALLLLAVALPLLRSGGEPAAPVYRAAGREPVRSLLPEEVPLEREGCVLRWTPGPAGSRYQLELAGESHGLLPAPPLLDEPSYAVPPAHLEPLAPGERLLWRVTVVGPEGYETASMTFLNSVR